MLGLELKLAEALAALWSQRSDVTDASLDDDEDEIIEFFSVRARWHAPRHRDR